MSESKHTIYGVLTALDREDVTRVLWTRTGEWMAAAMSEQPLVDQQGRASAGASERADCGAGGSDRNRRPYQQRPSAAYRGAGEDAADFPRRGAVMTKERTSNERFEIVGLTKAEVDRCMEVLCGGPVPWDRGYCFASSELFARPSRYGPEPSNEGRKSMSDEPQTEMKPLVVVHLAEHGHHDRQAVDGSKSK